MLFSRALFSHYPISLTSASLSPNAQAPQLQTCMQKGFVAAVLCTIGPLNSEFPNLNFPPEESPGLFLVINSISKYHRHHPNWSPKNYPVFFVPLSSLCILKNISVLLFHILNIIQHCSLLSTLSLIWTIPLLLDDSSGMPNSLRTSNTLFFPQPCIFAHGIPPTLNGLPVVYTNGKWYTSPWTPAHIPQSMKPPPFPLTPRAAWGFCTICPSHLA